MRVMCTIVIAVISILLTPTTTRAQDVLVPFDVQGRVFTITAKDEAQLHLFPNVADLIEARVWRTGDTTYVLEITSGSPSSPVRTRRDLTPSGYEDLRKAYAAALGAVVVTEELDQRGRSTLLWGTTIAGLVYYGTAMNFMLFGDDWGEDNAAVALPYLLAGGGGYLLTSALTSNATVTKGDASLAVTGLIQGPMHGWLLSVLISGDDVDYRVGFGASFVMGIGETAAGYYIARSSDMSEGTADLIGNTSIFGMITAGAAAFTVLGEVNGNAALNSRLLTGLTLAGSAGGILVGNVMATSQRYSAGDASVASLPTLLAATLPVAIAATVTYDGDAEVITGLTAITTALGIWAGDRLVVDKEFTDDQGTLIGLGTFGGALLGVGIGWLAKADEKIAGMAWAGAATGFGISYATLGREAGVRARSMGEWQWNINPVAPLLAQSLNGLSVPFLSLSGRF